MTILPTHLTLTSHNNLSCRESPLAIPLALYLHIPFCRTRCTYCAFNTYTSLEHHITAYMHALAAELRYAGGTETRPADTIYFGGGTPSLIPTSELALVLSECQNAFAITPDVEITLEANPGDTDLTYLRAMRQLGVNRLSIGMQSAHASELRFFARRHTVEDVWTTVRVARQAGFTNISLDLIYGVSGQTLAMWQHSLHAALALAPNHLSLYSLGIEDSTPMQRWLSRGQINQPDPDLAADMYEWASETLTQEGFEQYEISNWARSGHTCRHNLHYWRNHPYLGFGAGAHGYAAHTRYVNVLHPEAYITRMLNPTIVPQYPLSPAADQIEPGDARDAMSDMLVMGLRLTREGVALASFEQCFGVTLWDVYGEALDRLIAHGLLERTPDDRVRLTPRARLLGNLVFVEFV